MFMGFELEWLDPKTRIALAFVVNRQLLQLDSSSYQIYLEEIILFYEF